MFDSVVVTLSQDTSSKMNFTENNGDTVQLS
jgi:hypothetical protein